MSDSHSALRASTQKIGPTELNFCFDRIGVTLINCPACPDYGSTGFITGECGDQATVGPLVQGWYRIHTTAPIYIQQLNPNDACDADPLNCGQFMDAGSIDRFYVDIACIDGILAVYLCAVSEGDTPQAPAQCLPNGCIAQVRINRLDTIVPISVAGENAFPPVPPPARSDTCTPKIPLPPTSPPVVDPCPLGSPTVVSSTPTEGAATIPVTQNITVTFDRAVQILEYSLSGVGSGPNPSDPANPHSSTQSPPGMAAPSSGQFSTVFVFDPLGNLTECNTYTFTIVFADVCGATGQFILHFITDCPV